MSEFDLDPQIEGAAGFGWEAHFRSPGVAPGDHRNLTTPVYACDPTGSPTPYGCTTCAYTCGAVTGRPCAC